MLRSQKSADRLTHHKRLVLINIVTGQVIYSSKKEKKYIRRNKKAKAEDKKEAREDYDYKMRWAYGFEQ